VIERLAPATRTLLRRAQREAAALHADSVGSEHLLIAALERSSAAAHVRDVIAPSNANLPLSAEAKEVLALSLGEALAQGHRQIQPRDVLLALAEHGGVDELLVRAGISLEGLVLETRAHTLKRMLSASPPATA
jgi:ATP-dependent Clp protease ATP-binding subunit ClpA